MNNNITHSAEGIKREELPIQICDEVWGIVENIQKIIPLVIEIDHTRRNGHVSDIITAQVRIENNIPKIVIFSNDVTEQIFTHEIFHYYRIISGYPIFKRTNYLLPEEINNLSNNIEHTVIYSELKKLGFDEQARSIIKWSKYNKMLQSSLDSLQSQLPKKVLDFVGARLTLKGLIDGIKYENIKEKLDVRFWDGITKGKLVYDELLKYNLMNKEDNFLILLKIANILNITRDDAIILKLNYLTRKILRFDPKNGELLFRGGPHSLDTFFSF